MRLVFGLIAAIGVIAQPAFEGEAWAQTSSEETSSAPVGGIERLITVWSFVKYHHPDARSGRLAMDPEFFELYSKIRSAPSVNDADRILVNWIMATGFGEPCDPCARSAEPVDVALSSPTPQWLASLPEGLSRPLQRIYDNRGAQRAHFLIHKEPRRDGSGPVVFSNEPNYRFVWPDNDPKREEALWALTLARTWSTLQYWFPYRDIMDQSPQALLPAAIDRLLQADTTSDYQNAVSSFAAGAVDSHVGIGQFYSGFMRADAKCTIPYSLRYIEGELVVDGRSMQPDGPLLAGDVLVAIEGQSVDLIANRIRPYISASHADVMGRALMSEARLGPCGYQSVEIVRNGEKQTIPVEWQTYRQHQINSFAPHYQPGKTIETLPGNIVYVRYQQLKKADIDTLRDKAKASAGLVLDMRGYVSEYLIPELGAMLTDKPVQYSRFISANAATPGEFFWETPITLEPGADGERITVPVVALIDHSAQSASEYVSMAWRAAGVPFFGSRSAGADGDVSKTPLPSGADMTFSSLGVFYPDKSPTQRIGVVPDIEVRPTIAGIAAGRDEVLERAIEHLKSAQR